MYSIGEIIDKLIIENIKLFNIRQKLNTFQDNDEEIIELNRQMTVLNNNRNTLISILDLKIDSVVSGKEKNVILEKVRTI